MPGRMGMVLFLGCFVRFWADIDDLTMAEQLPHYELFTDGACSGNPGPGGWAYLLRDMATGEELERWGGDPKTTNNQMELLAVLTALESLGSPAVVELYADSKYVVNGLSEWMAGWKKRGWRKADKKPVLNLELWKRLDVQAERHKLTSNWVAAHNEHVENERCDFLAVAARERYQ